MLLYRSFTRSSWTCMPEPFPHAVIGHQEGAPRGLLRDLSDQHSVSTIDELKELSSQIERRSTRNYKPLRV
jgi:hypothetical protein